jgi:alpha-1,3-rhamnosyl/mannosyltransferase
MPRGAPGVTDRRTGLNLAYHADFEPTRPTGVGRYGFELLKALSGAGTVPEVWVEQCFARGWAARGPAAGRLRVIPRPVRVNRLILPRIWSLAGGIDFLHCPGCILLPVAGRTRRSTAVHDLGPFRLPEMKRPDDTAAWQARIRSAVVGSDLVLVSSRATMEDMLRYFPRSGGRAVEVPLGIDHLAPGPAAPVAAGSGAHVLCVGTIEPRKNIDTLLRAYASLRRADPGVPPLVIAGDDGYGAEATRALPGALGIGGCVSFTGYVDGSRLSELYSSACCLVHPAHWEGFGFTVPEAFAHGLPTAVSDRASLGEFFRGASWMVDPDDPESIAEGIRLCLSRGVTPSQQEERVRLFGSLTWKRCADRTLEEMRRRCGR